MNAKIEEEIQSKKMTKNKTAHENVVDFLLNC